MPNVVTSDRFHVLLMIGQYLPLQLNFKDRILHLFRPRTDEKTPLQTTLQKLSQLPWEDRKEASQRALLLLQQGWQQLNNGSDPSTLFHRGSKEFFRGQLYCFQGVCAVINEDTAQPQLVFDYISKAKEAFSFSHDLYDSAVSAKAIELLESLLKNTPPQKKKIHEEQDAVSHSSLGRQYIEEKKWALAFKHFKKAHKKNPNCPLHETEKTLSEHLKQVNELYYLCQSTPIVIRKATQSRYREMIRENLKEIEHLATKAQKSLIFNKIDMERWTGALTYFHTKEDA